MNRLFKWRTVFLFPMPSALSGIARILDIGCTYNAYNHSDSPEEADWKAIYSDWAIVGQDLVSAAREINVCLPYDKSMGGSYEL